jgi:DNA-3-methyladenine glycosylase II
MTPQGPESTFTLTPNAPYNFVANANFITHYKGHEGSDTFDGETLTRPVDLGDTVAMAAVRSTGTTERPSLTVTLSGQSGKPTDETIASATRQIERVIGANGNPQPFYDFAATIPALAHLPELFHGLHLTQATTLFETITWAVLGQQISANVAASMRRRMTETYGRNGEIDGKPYALFPRPRDLESANIEDLRSLGLSQRKAEYTLGLRDEFGSGRLTETALSKMDDAEVETELLKLRGIGPWTVHWLLIRGLGREDALPVGDVALQKTLGELVTGETFSPQELIDYAEQFRPYRSYLTIYLFALIRARRVGAV